MLDKQKSVLCRYQKSIAAFGITLLGMIVFWSFFVIHYETNDDKAMADILYGVNGQRSCYLIFLPVFLGEMMQACLVLLPSLPWYLIFQCVGIFAGFATLIYLCLCRFGWKQAILPIAMLFMFCGYDFFVSIQFSRTAGICVVAGVLLLLHVVREQKRWMWYIPPVLITLMGSMYRFKLFLMLLPALFGIWAVWAWEAASKKNWRELVRLCIPVLAVIGICTGFYAANSYIYNSSPEWSEYLTFNRLRAELMDYGFPNYDENQALYEECGITSSDYALYKAWDFDDPEQFTIEVMEKLVAAKEKQHVSLKEFFAEWPIGILQYRYFPLLILGIVFVGIFSRSRKQIGLLAYEVLVLLAVEYYLYTQGRYLKSRIDVCLFLAFFMVLVLHCWNWKVFSDFSKQQALAVFTISAMLVQMLPGAVSDAEKDRENLKANGEHTTYEVLASDPERIYFTTTSGNYTHLYDVTTVPEVGSARNIALLGGWRTHSPNKKYIWDQYGIANPYRDVVDNPNAMLVSSSSVELHLKHIQSYYNAGAVLSCVRIVDNTYVYRVVTHAPELDDSVSEPDNGSAVYDMTVTETASGLDFQGYLYMPEVNSFAANIYLDIWDNEGRHTYYTTQYQRSDDIMQGGYGAFTCSVGWIEPTAHLYLYLETDETLSWIDMGSLSDYLQ